MHKGSRGSAGLAVVLLLLAATVAFANLVIVSIPDPSAGLPADLAGAIATRYQSFPTGLLYLALAPLVLGLIGAIAAGKRGTAVAPPAPESQAQPAPAAPPAETAALRLLALLQQDARLVDFVQEDIDGYEDAQIGAAARTIHAGCRKALAGRIELTKIFTEDEGTRVTVPNGFDPAEVRLTGSVAGQPPFHGTLQHSGWRATKVQWPESPANLDATVIAPAEVEVA